MATLREQYYASLKSTEIMDWVEIHIIRKISFCLAYVCNKMGIHPNAVTIGSMILGAGSSYFFAHGSYHYQGIEGLVYNVIAVAMLFFADTFDNADGQLARMSGKGSKMGRILDGMAGFVWFIPIYLGFAWRIIQNHTLEFNWLGIEENETNVMIYSVVTFLIVLYTGFMCNSGQERMSDYYVQIHLFFQKGEGGSELDNSQKQLEILQTLPADASWYERMFMKTYVGYTRNQESRTPKFQHFIATLGKKFGGASNMPLEVRQKCHAFSRDLMPYVCLIGFEYRAIAMALCALLDIPLIYMLLEIVVFGCITSYIIHRHEANCERIEKEL